MSITDRNDGLVAESSEEVIATDAVSTRARPGASTKDRTFDMVVVANRLPVVRERDDEGDWVWRTSPGGLVAAMDAVMRTHPGAWVGWTGDTDEVPEPFDLHEGAFLVPVCVDPDEVRDFYEGFSNATLWPLYHDVTAKPVFHRRWWSVYQRVNQRFAEAAAASAAPGATVWVHDYQLQLVPALLRQMRPDVRIGWFNHIPFPPTELFSQLPWREDVLRGLLGADLLGFQRQSDADNFIRTCRRLLGSTSTDGVITSSSADDGEVAPPSRHVRVAAVPIATDAVELEDLARTERVISRAREIRRSLGDPEVLLLGVDRLDYTKGIRHRLRAISELFADGDLVPGRHTFVQVATPSRDRVTAYRDLRDEIERMVGRINGDHGVLGATAVHYLHQSHPRDEVTALFLAADVMVVTPLRDGMNLVAKEFVASRADESGALVLSEFAGAADELEAAYLCNPHDIGGVKRTLLHAVHDDPGAMRRRMQSMRRQVVAHDVHAWAAHFLQILKSTPGGQRRG